MNILPLPSLQDNYIWVIQVGDQVIAIDPGEAAPLRTFLAQQELNLTSIWLTHNHSDHTGGVAELKQYFPACAVLGESSWLLVNKGVQQDSSLPLPEGRVMIWQVPGHTADHLAYLLLDQQQQWHVFCGDTLFSAGCGRVFSGTVNQLYQSLQRFNQLPASTLFYPAHEYTLANLHFAHAVEPHNQAIKDALLHSNKIPTLPVTLAHERQINPFLRLDQPEVQHSLILAGLPANEAKQPLAAFAFLRQWKNRF